MTTQDKPKHLIENGIYYEYTQAADPIGSGATSKIPYAEFASELHETGGTRIIPFDISAALRRSAITASTSIRGTGFNFRLRS